MSILIYGGAFDPPHLGHIKIAQAVQQVFSFKNFIFVPSKIPVLKAASLASAKQRIAMLNLALEDYPDFKIDTREITRDTPSYMVDTLDSFRKELGQHEAITLLLGRDAFLALPQWHRWEMILKLCNLLIVDREGTTDHLPEILKSLNKSHETTNKDTVLIEPYSYIYYFNAGHYQISSQWLREQIKQGKKVSEYLSPKVSDYIKFNKLYSKR